MSALREVLAAMDRADVDFAVGRARADLDAGEMPTSAGIGMATGQQIIDAFCDAFGLDQSEVLEIANERGFIQAHAMAMAAPGMFSAHQLPAYSALVTSGVITGLRIGLMVADRQSKASG